MSALAASPIYQSFTKTIETLTRRQDRGKVFNNFLMVAICSYHRTNVQTRLQERDGKNEEGYMTTISKYTKEEIHTFSKLVTTFGQSAYAMPYSDILGQYFTEHITKGQNG